MEKTRDQIDEKYKWKLEDIYSSNQEFDDDFNNLKLEYNKISEFKDRVLDSSENLYQTLTLKFDMQIKLGKLYYYSRLRWDEDINSSISQNRFFKIENLDNEISKHDAYIMPELLKSDYQLVKKYIDEDSRLKEYKFYLQKIYLLKDHVLSADDEKTLLEFNDIANHFEKGATFLTISEVAFEDIYDEDGKKVELNISSFKKYITSKNRRVREEAYNSFNDGYNKLIQSLANNYIGHVKYDELEARLRHYKDSLSADLENSYIDEKIYRNLIITYKENLSIYHEFLKLRKQVLNVEQLKPWDLAVSIAPMNDKKYTFEQAKEIIVNALSIYGDEYSNIVKKAFDGRWIDVYPNKGKINGWYSWGVKDSHPIILSNFQGKISDVLTLAHEMGHLVNFELTNENQPIQYFDHTLFEAEVASLTNEFIVGYYLIRHTDDKNEKIEIINNMINTFIDNFFSATNGGIFEEEVHNYVKDGKVLNYDIIHNIWQEISNELTGDIVNKDNIESNGWGRISHFYSSFYYFKYATGVTMASYNVQRLLKGNREDINKYCEYLKLGSSGYPIDNLKSAGIDITNIETFTLAMDFIKKLIEEFKNELNS